MLPQTVLIFATLLCLGCEANNKKNDSIFCNNVETPFDFESAMGTWHLVASIEPKYKPHTNRSFAFICMTVELTGILNERSRDLILKVEGLDTMFLKDVEGKGGIKTTSGCYQNVKSLNDDIVHFESSQINNIMMMQFHFINGSERFLVQNIWHSILPDRIALVHSKNKDYEVSEKDMKPVMDFLTKLRGSEQILEFCMEDSHKNDISANSL